MIIYKARMTTEDDQTILYEGPDKKAANEASQKALDKANEDGIIATFDVLKVNVPDEVPEENAGFIDPNSTIEDK